MHSADCEPSKQKQLLTQQAQIREKVNKRVSHTSVAYMNVWSNSNIGEVEITRSTGLELTR